MQIEFKKEQIVKDEPQSILIDYVEYKLSLPKWMIKVIILLLITITHIEFLI